MSIKLSYKEGGPPAWAFCAETLREKVEQEQGETEAAAATKRRNGVIVKPLSMLGSGPPAIIAQPDRADDYNSEVLYDKAHLGELFLQLRRLHIFLLDLALPSFLLPTHDCFFCSAATSIPR